MKTNEKDSIQSAENAHGSWQRAPSASPAHRGRRGAGHAKHRDRTKMSARHLGLLVLLGCLGWIIGCAKSLDHTSQIPTRSASLSGSTAADPVVEALPGSRPSRHEEIWIIAASRTRSISQPADSGLTPTSGALCVRAEDGLVPMPLKQTEVQADLAGHIATVKLRQQFHNPHSNKIEAVYVFPLPENAAINEFVMTIGVRQIRGIIRERAEAEAIYREAKRQGYVASLLTQERPNIFTQSVANLEPGQAIAVTLRYFHTLAYDDGWYEFVFPMVVGPRFNPPGWTNGIGAVPRRQAGTSVQPRDVRYLPPNERSGQDIGLVVNLDAGAGGTIEETRCASHRTTWSRPGPGRVQVSLNRDDSIPNRDFVLRYRVAGDQVKSGWLTHQDARGGYFTLMLYPPADLKALRRHPLELVFVLDCSGSMSGKPIAQAKAAILRALERLEPGDSFQVISFSERASALGPHPLVATEENLARGRAYVASLSGDGGTSMLEGIKAALDFPHDPNRLRFVCFLTDGYIGNEMEILAAVEQKLSAARIFSFGVGSSPNRYLLDGLARLGRGAVAYLGLHDDASQLMDGFVNRISHPALTDVQIDWGDLRVEDVYPTRLPDLFVGRPIVVTGRCSGGTETIRVEGMAGGTSVRFEISTRTAGAGASTGAPKSTVSSPAPNATSAPSAAALPLVWARMKIAALADRLAVVAPADQRKSAEVTAEIRGVALNYGLMSAYTAFVAVDASRKTTGGEAVPVPVAVPLPEGVNPGKTIEQ
jgi:Ca-activated chloride channel family protein